MFLCLAATSVRAGGLPVALSYEQNEDRTAFIEQVRQARKGDSGAQWQVGSTYLILGEPARALPMLQAAAVAGHPPAAALLGWLHENGRGTRQSAADARHWYHLAAEQGDAGSMVALGRLSLQESTAEARSAARKWFEKAAALGNPDGQYHVGWILATPRSAGPVSSIGQGDNAEAFQWFLKAAEQGHVGAQVAVATHLLAAKGASQDRKAAATWLERAASQKDPVAHYLLGTLHQEKGEAGLDRARDAYRVAAVAGHREAQYALAAILVKSSAEADRKQAAGWFAKAYEAGHKAAANRLGEIHRDGIGVTQQLDKAKDFFYRAAEQNDANAMYNLAQMQNEGLGGPRDTNQALEWYSRAAEQGHEAAAGVVEGLLGGAIKTSSLGLKGFWQ